MFRNGVEASSRYGLSSDPGAVSRSGAGASTTMLDPIYSLDELLPSPNGSAKPSAPFERVMPWMAVSTGADAVDEKPLRRKRRPKSARKTN